MSKSTFNYKFYFLHNIFQQSALFMIYAFRLQHSNSKRLKTVKT